MEQTDLMGELTPPHERRKAEGIDASILEAIKERKISYPAEIVGDTGINRQTVFDHVRMLARKGNIERVYLHQRVPELLKERLEELWSIGLKGAQIKRMSWYVVADGTKKGK